MILIRRSMITHWDLLSKTRYSLRTCLEVILIPSFPVKPLTVISRRGHQLLSVLTWVVSETVFLLLLLHVCCLHAPLISIHFYLLLKPILWDCHLFWGTSTLHILEMHVLNINLKQREMFGLWTEDLENSFENSCALGLPSLAKNPYNKQYYLV